MGLEVGCGRDGTRIDLWRREFGGLLRGGNDMVERLPGGYETAMSMLTGLDEGEGGTD